MKISRAWLQEYFKDPLPSAEQLSELFTFHAFEVEGVEQKGDDAVLDIKVLPDRAHYALSHRGIAREISFITAAPINVSRINSSQTAPARSSILELDIRDGRCRRDSKIVIQNISNGESPTWLREKLELLGQRSISFIVDVTNYVMLDVGQPIHAFDLDKLTKKEGKVKIILKAAAAGDKITILGGKEYILESGTLVFADGYNNDLPLDIAGIKGGAVAEIDATTKNIIVLAANFDPAYIRKISTKLGIRTDASKRSENGIAYELTMDGLLHVAELIQKQCPEATIEGVVDYYPQKLVSQPVVVTHQFIQEKLGTVISQEEIEKILSRLECVVAEHDGTYTITPPYYRFDIKIPEDVVEEIGRIHGYEKIEPLLPTIPEKIEEINKQYYWIERIKEFFVQEGFSEVCTYTLTDTGSVEIQNPLASDKGFVRNSLVLGLEKSLEFNAKHAAFLGIEEIKIFEIGTVFTQDGEYISLGIAAHITKSIKNKKLATEDLLLAVSKKLEEMLGVSLELVANKNDEYKVVAANLSEIIEKLQEPLSYDIYHLGPVVKYQSLSPYPFSVRDIAVFVPAGIGEEDLRNIIVEKAGQLLVRNTLFDVFKKTFPDGLEKTSYAFRLVLQSKEKTLTEEEINTVMKNITDDMNSREGWQVR